MHVNLVTQAFVILAAGRLVSSEAPYSENVASAVSASSAANAIRAASEAASILKDSTQESAKEDALEEAALTQAAMQDDVGLAGITEPLNESSIPKVMTPKEVSPTKEPVT